MTLALSPSVWFRRAAIFLTVLPLTAAEPVSFGTAPSVGVSVFRMLGALALVIALFFCVAWLFKNGLPMRRMAAGPRKLQVLEAKSLGPRQAVYVVGYENQRLLIGATAGGLSLLSHLPESTGTEPEAPIVPVSFGETLMQVLGRKS